MGTEQVAVQSGFAASKSDADRAVIEIISGRRNRGGTMIALSSPGARSVVLAQARRGVCDEVVVVGAPDVDVCVALGFSLYGLGDWVKVSPRDADAWLGDAAVAAAVLATDIDLTQTGLAWRDGLHEGREVVQARAALLAFFGADRRVFTTPRRIDQDRLLTYDRDGRLSRAVIRDQQTVLVLPVSVSDLERNKIRTAAILSAPRSTISPSAAPPTSSGATARRCRSAASARTGRSASPPGASRSTPAGRRSSPDGSRAARRRAVRRTRFVGIVRSDGSRRVGHPGRDRARPATTDIRVEGLTTPARPARKRDHAHPVKIMCTCVQ